jgi:signal transduction histidine kinase
MTIQKQQRVLLAVIGILFLVKFSIIIQSNRVTRLYVSNDLIMTQIIKNVSDINLVSSDYLLYHNDRPLTQIDRRLAALETLLDTLRLSQPGYRDIHDEMRQELVRARQLFERVKENHVRFNRQIDTVASEAVDLFVNQETENLAKNLSISSLALSNNAHRLLKSLAEKQERDNRFYDSMVLAVMAFSFLVLTVAVYLFSQRLVRSTLLLKESTSRIAGGDLTSRIEMSGDDELTDLAGEINFMSEKLQLSYRALEDEIEERKRTEESLLESEQQLRHSEEDVTKLNRKLENQLLSLQEANREMEAFTYSVSHDLRAPLRHMSGFVELLERRDISGLDEKSRHYLNVISEASKKMGCLIDDLLLFSRMGRGELMRSRVDLQLLTREVIEELSKDIPADSKVQWRIGELPVVTGDPAMLRLVLVNLISNAFKFSSQAETPLIEVGELPPEGNSHILYVRDNGAGFDMKYVDKLFGLFQRLHSTEEFEGTGVGLANVHRIIGRHGGRTWAEGELNRGATFYFTLPQLN